MSLEELEKAAIEKALKRHGGNLSDVARQLGIGRSTLYRKLEQYELRDKKDEG
jgi:DNA-binding NtrC family response regulator